MVCRLVVEFDLKSFTTIHQNACSTPSTLAKRPFTSVTSFPRSQSTKARQTISASSSSLCSASVKSSSNSCPSSCCDTSELYSKTSPKGSFPSPEQKQRTQTDLTCSARLTTDFGTPYINAHFVACEFRDKPFATLKSND